MTVTIVPDQFPNAKSANTDQLPNANLEKTDRSGNIDQLPNADKLENVKTTIVPRVLVSAAPDAPDYAKITWFSVLEIERCLICTFGDASCDANDDPKSTEALAKKTTFQKYRSIFKKSNYTTDSNAAPIIGWFTRSCDKKPRKPMVIILLNPPTLAQMVEALYVCFDRECPVLCHFTAVNAACFNWMPEFIPEFVYDSGLTEYSYQKRYFRILNKQASPVALPPNKSGVFIVQSHGAKAFGSNYGSRKTTECVLKHFVHPSSFYASARSHSDQRLRSQTLSWDDLLVFIKSNGGTFLDRFLIYQQNECPDLLVPRCLHIFCDMEPGAIIELEQRVFNNPVLLETALFVVITTTLTKKDIENLRVFGFVLEHDEQNRIYGARGFCGMFDETSKTDQSAELISDSPMEAKLDQIADTSKDAKIDETIVDPETKDRVIKTFRIKERIIKAKKETTLRFFVGTTLKAGEVLTLCRGFPVEGNYALFWDSCGQTQSVLGDNKHICDSTVTDDKTVFVLPSECPKGWMHIEMTNATEDRYLYCPKTGQPYFSEYEIIISGCASVLSPHTRYHLKLNPETLLGIRVNKNVPFILVLPPTEDSPSPHHNSNDNGEIQFISKLKHFMTVNTDAVLGTPCDAQLVFKAKTGQHFFPKTVEVAEAYFELQV